MYLNYTEIKNAFLFVIVFVLAKHAPNPYMLECFEINL